MPHNHMHMIDQHGTIATTQGMVQTAGTGYHIVGSPVCAYVKTFRAQRIRNFLGKDARIGQLIPEHPIGFIAQQ